MTAYLQAVWAVWLELAPWLLLGATVAAVLHVVLPPSFVGRHLTGRAGVLKAVAFGVPMPLCSCGVIPTGLGLKKQGASDGSAVGFLISTPQTGVDSILVSASFLGWPFAIFKLASAAVLGVFGGWLTDAVAGGKRPEAVAPDPDSSRRHTLRDGWDHGVLLIRTIWHWLVFGVLVSAALTTFVPPETFSQFTAGGGALAMLAVLAVSVPLYVCATASVPIAAALVATGFPPGAALVFLMAGPATNLATIGAVQRAFGRSALLAYLATVVGGSMALGMAFDFVVDASTAQSAMAHHHGDMAWWAVASGVALAAGMVWFAFEEMRDLLRRWTKTEETAGPPVIEVPVQGMTCNGCVRKLEGRLRAAPGVEEVEVSLEPGQARVRGQIDAEAVRAVVRETGYEVPTKPQTH